MHVLPLAQTVGPVQPWPPHWPYLVWVEAGAVLVLVLVEDVLFVVDDVEVELFVVVVVVFVVDPLQVNGRGPGIV